MGIYGFDGGKNKKRVDFRKINNTSYTGLEVLKNEMEVYVSLAGCSVALFLDYMEYGQPPTMRTGPIYVPLVLGIDSLWPRNCGIGYMLFDYGTAGDTSGIAVYKIEADGTAINWTPGERNYKMYGQFSYLL